MERVGCQGSPPLVDREMSDLFMGTLQGTFAERMVGCPVTGFADIVVAGERIESWLRMGKNREMLRRLE